MTYRLLIDYAALDVFASLKKARSTAGLSASPPNSGVSIPMGRYTRTRPSDRSLHVSIVGDYAITYWEDFADRHVKVLEIACADR